ncbi:HD domain-containing protein [Clostridium perfringens]|uniref:HD domain-containing protein n=1 Tax=Clostridium perfringens TaxID=1502 RepID=UPI0028FEA252|nr:HD domain-containing protein [Clostridium perfringens]MDU2516605.1 HD domain-containing protein [Clostridium perfringens]
MKKVDDLDEIIKIITTIVQKSNLKKYRKAHSKYVANLAYIISKNEGLLEKDAKLMAIAGLLHDYEKKKKEKIKKKTHAKRMAKNLKKFFLEKNIELESNDIEIIKESIRYHSNKKSDYNKIKKSHNRQYIKVLQDADYNSKSNMLFNYINLKKDIIINMTDDEIETIKRKNNKI